MGAQDPTALSLQAQTACSKVSLSVYSASAPRGCTAVEASGLHCSSALFTCRLRPWDFTPESAAGRGDGGQSVLWPEQGPSPASLVFAARAPESVWGALPWSPLAPQAVWPQEQSGDHRAASDGLTALIGARWPSRAPGPSAAPPEPWRPSSVGLTQCIRALPQVRMIARWGRPESHLLC